MDYHRWLLDLIRDDRTLVDIVRRRVSDLWIAPAGDATKAKQVTRNDHAVGLRWADEYCRKRVRIGKAPAAKG
jgi:hypothetical protein